MPPRIGISTLRRRAGHAPSIQIRITGRQLVVRSMTTSPNLLRPATAATPPNILRLPEDYVPPTKPPAARPPETRKSQLIRTYTSLLRTTPLMLFFEHNSLTAGEWAAVRRELRKALAAVPPPSVDLLGGNTAVDAAQEVQLQVLRTRMFAVALKIVEFFDAEAAARDPSTARLPRSAGGGALVHDLSEAAYQATRVIGGSANGKSKRTELGETMQLPPDSVYAQLAPYMTGAVAGLVFPAVWPQHLAAALSVLAPVPGKFPAPTRRKSPGYYDPACQSGLAKLRLMGGRVEGRVLDFEGVRWVGGIEGGLDGLRAQLVAVLQGAGLGLTGALEGAGRSLWLGLEGRRIMLEEETKPAAMEDKAAEEKTA